MRIGGQSASGLQLAPEVFQFLFRQAAFQKGSRIHSWSGVALKINNVAIAVFGACVQKMVERDLIQSGRRGEG
jgi:hypothetical protein